MEFQLQADTAYAVRIRATGSTTIGGYVVISDGSGSIIRWICSRQRPKTGMELWSRIDGAEKVIEFFVIPGETAVYHFTPVWGEYEGSREDGIALLSDSADAGAYVGYGDVKGHERRQRGGSGVGCRNCVVFKQNPDWRRIGNW